MQVKSVVFEKILEEEKKHGELEFGGWLIVDNGIVSDIVFDIELQSVGYVKFATKSILQLPKKVRDRVRGWFHRHPINGLSGLDWKTTCNLTKFWGECYTLVLQSNGKILALKTGYGQEIFVMPKFFEMNREEYEMPKCQTDSGIK